MIPLESTRQLRRLPAVTSIVGAALLIGACIAPTDPEPADAEEHDDAEATADDGSVALSDDAADETDEVSSAIHEQRGRRCDRRNDWHCRRGHRGWRWVRDRDGHWDGRPGWGERDDRHDHLGRDHDRRWDDRDRRRLCCVRVRW